jgi:hypothetical protein
MTGPAVFNVFLAGSGDMRKHAQERPKALLVRIVCPNKSDTFWH